MHISYLANKEGERMTQVDWMHFRKSVRKYKNTRLDADFFNMLKETIFEVKDIIPETSYDIQLIEEGEGVKSVLSGLLSKYTYVKAPHYLLLTCRKRSEDIFNLGFVGEQLVKYLTLKNLGSCWIGPKLDVNKLKGIASIDEAHEFIVLIAFGEPVAPLSFIRSRKRKAIEEVFLGYDKLSDTDQFIAESILTAPSAINNQPWRFYLNNGVWDYYKASPKGLFANALTNLVTLDTGIGLFHVVETAESFGSTIAFEVMTFDNRDQNYLGTLNIED